MSTVVPGDCVISTIASYELHTGIAKCAAPNKEQAKVDLPLKTVTELVFDQAAARTAGMIRGLLESQCEMIGPYDVLLAAQALTSGLTVVTANTDEFRRVPGLTVEDWQTHCPEGSGQPFDASTKRKIASFAPTLANPKRKRGISSLALRVGASSGKSSKNWD